MHWRRSRKALGEDGGMNRCCGTSFSVRSKRAVCIAITCCICRAVFSEIRRNVSWAWATTMPEVETTLMRVAGVRDGLGTNGWCEGPLVAGAKRWIGRGRKGTDFNGIRIDADFDGGGCF